MSLRTDLEAQVAARNLANAEANRLAPIVREACRPFIGKKIRKADGSRTKAFSEAINAALPEWKADGYATPAIWVSTARGLRVYLEVKTCVSTNSTGPGIAHYAEASLAIGTIENGILVSIVGTTETGEPLRTNYTAEGVKAARAAVDEAEQALRDAQSALAPFNRYDR